jgi:hypothetical protein
MHWEEGTDETKNGSGDVFPVFHTWDLVFIEPKRKLPPQGGRTLKGRRKKKRKGREERVG